MALMSMKLWQLANLAIPLIAILLVQTFIMATFAYFVTFNVMGRDYDAAVIACGHCGFGLGATQTLWQTWKHLQLQMVSLLRLSSYYLSLEHYL